MSERICPVCDGPLVRRPRETQSKWRIRQTCSTKCASELARSRFAAVVAARPKSAPKACEVCGAEMTRSYAESRARFDRRSTCSRKCQGERTTLKAGKVPMSARIKLAAPIRAMGRPALPDVPVRHCVSCNREIPRPAKMAAARYRARTTCGSDECQAKQNRRLAEAKPEVSETVLLQKLAEPTEKQRLAWLSATAAERRLFAPDLRRAFEAGA